MRPCPTSRQLLVDRGMHRVADSIDEKSRDIYVDLWRELDGPLCGSEAARIACDAERETMRALVREALVCLPEDARYTYLADIGERVSEGGAR